MPLSDTFVVIICQDLDVGVSPPLACTQRHHGILTRTGQTFTRPNAVFRYPFTLSLPFDLFPIFSPHKTQMSFPSYLQKVIQKSFCEQAPD